MSYQEFAAGYNGAFVDIKTEKEVSQIKCYLQDKNCFELEKTADEHTCFDILTAIFIGLIGSFVSSGEKIKRLFDSVHTDASLKNPKMLIGKLLHHQNDCIDHASRGGKTFATYLHRLYGGHDILSVGHGDNPFVLLCKQYGIPKGIIQAIRHLVADSFSKCGGILPGTSYLDFTKEDGTVGNLIDEWAKDISHGKNCSPQTVFGQMFSIKMQDVCSTTVIDLLLNLYEKSIKISSKRKAFSKIAKSQLRIIALLTVCTGAASVGLVKYKGIPKINIPAVSALIFEVGHLCILNSAELKSVIKRGNELEAGLYTLKQTV